jgi:DNA-binding NarL/FixJ family response regulator
MDIEMPLMDGVEATRWIKQVWPQIKVVILSVHDELRERVMNEGADAFLVKGEPPERLLTILEQLHEQVKPGESHESQAPGAEQSSNQTNDTSGNFKEHGT